MRASAREEIGMTNGVTRFIRSMTIAVAVMLAAEAHAETQCEMDFRLEGWSAFYKTASGSGKITCDNGRSAVVRIKSKGGGITVGKFKIVHGYGKFTTVEHIGEVFGDYAVAEAHAGAGKEASAQVLTKGTVSLTLTGKGRGVDLGFSFGKVTIENVTPRHRRRTPHHD